MGRCGTQRAGLDFFQAPLHRWSLHDSVASVKRSLVSRSRFWPTDSQNVALNDCDASDEGREIMMVQERLNHGDDAWYALVLGT